MSDISMTVRPCPHCGNPPMTNLKGGTIDGNPVYCVMCECGAAGTWCMVQEDAIERWNRRKPLEAKAGAGQVHEEPKNIEWVCAQIADCVWGCSWPPLDLTEEEISRIREGAQYLMTSLRPAPAAITEGLREAFIAGAWWHLMGCHGALTHEKAHDEAKRRYSDAALRQSAKEGA